MTDEKSLYEAVRAAEDVVFWLKRYLETREPDIYKILLAAIKEFEENKP